MDKEITWNSSYQPQINHQLQLFPALFQVNKVVKESLHTGEFAYDAIVL